MHNNPIYWTAADHHDALVGALHDQVKRMMAQGFHVDVTSTATGWLFSSPECGNFVLTGGQTHGAIDLGQTDGLATLLILGVHGYRPTALLVAGADGVQLTHAQRQQIVKERIVKASHFDEALLLVICGLMTSSMIKKRLAENASGDQTHQPFVRF